MFDGWLAKCEEKVAFPLRVEGDPADIKHQLDQMKVRVWNLA